MPVEEIEHQASDGLWLHVEIDCDDDANGAPTVVLVHGLTSNLRQTWYDTGIAPRLRAAGLRIVAYDARGHGRSDRPHDAARYGDARLAQDLVEVVETYGGGAPTVAGYSMGAAVVLVALASGLRVRNAVVGAAAPAVLEWSAHDEATAQQAIAALDGDGGSRRPDQHGDGGSRRPDRDGDGGSRRPDRDRDEDASAEMRAWAESAGIDRHAIAAFLRGHQPVVTAWDAITVPVVVAAGRDDAMAARPDAIATRLARASVVDLPGDHIGALLSRELADAIVDAATATSPRRDRLEADDELRDRGAG